MEASRRRLVELTVTELHSCKRKLLQQLARCRMMRGSQRKPGTVRRGPIAWPAKVRFYGVGESK